MHAPTWINLETVMLKEQSQTQGPTYRDSTPMELPRSANQWRKKADRNDHRKHEAIATRCRILWRVKKSVKWGWGWSHTCEYTIKSLNFK
jgi:hypothetical protein